MNNYKFAIVSFLILFTVATQSNIIVFSEERTLVKLEKPIPTQNVDAIHTDNIKHEHKDWVNKVRCYLRDRFRICF